MNLPPEMMPHTHCHQCWCNSDQLAASTPEIVTLTAIFVLKLDPSLTVKWIGSFEIEGAVGNHTQKFVAMDFHITMYRGAASVPAHRNVYGLQQKNPQVPQLICRHVSQWLNPYLPCCTLVFSSGAPRCMA
jgi:hypothetical protein